MTKEEYFNIKHEAIAAQFNVDVKTIELLRSFALGSRKMSRAQIIIWLLERIETTREKKKCKHCSGTGWLIKGEINPKKHHAQALYLVKKVDEADWKDVVYPYEFKEKNNL